MSKHTQALPYAVGARYTNSDWYDAATAEVVHGWQVFEQHSPDGKPTGRKSFVNNSGALCGIEIAEEMRKRAITEAAPELLEALKRLLNAEHDEHLTPQGVRNLAKEVIAKAEGATT